jgi:hypothetical protein
LHRRLAGLGGAASALAQAATSAASIGAILGSAWRWVIAAILARQGQHATHAL